MLVLRELLEALWEEVAPAGPAWTALYCALALGFLFERNHLIPYYVGILSQGKQPEGSLERKDYDDLRKSLTGGNLVVRLYFELLQTSLDKVDRFFGDAGTEQRVIAELAGKVEQLQSESAAKLSQVSERFDRIEHQIAALRSAAPAN
jgi:hypothetical protein